MNHRESFSRSAIAQASETVRRLNPELFGVGGLPRTERKQEVRRALDSNVPTQKSSRGRLVKVGGPVLRITFVSFRHRVVADGDNAAVGFKPLRDTIARYFDLDDRDRNIEWQYRQVETRGQQGTAVKIELL